MAQPYLFRVSVPLRSLPAAAALSYDERRQVAVLASDPDGAPAVLRSDIGALTTKKADVEKGEDQKDRWR